MENKRFGPTDSKGMKPVDVNLAAFADIKTREDLKAEKGRIFGHLGAAAQDAAYEELADELKLQKAVVASVAQPAPAVKSAVATS